MVMTINKFKLKLKNQNKLFNQGHLNVSNECSSTGNPTQALKILLNPSFYLHKLLISGVPSSVTGALHKYPKTLKVVPKFLNSPSSILY